MLPLVGVRGELVVLVGLAEDQDIVASSEGVRVDLHRVKVSVGVGALGLVGGAPVIVPDWKLINIFRFGVEGLGLVPDPLASPVNPDVASLDSAQWQLETCHQGDLTFPSAPAGGICSTQSCLSHRSDSSSPPINSFSEIKKTSGESVEHKLTVQL